MYRSEIHNNSLVLTIPGYGPVLSISGLWRKIFPLKKTVPLSSLNEILVLGEENKAFGLISLVTKQNILGKTPHFMIFGCELNEIFDKASGFSKVDTLEVTTPIELSFQGDSNSKEHYKHDALTQIGKGLANFQDCRAEVPLEKTYTGHNTAFVFQAESFISNKDVLSIEDKGTYRIINFYPSMGAPYNFPRATLENKAILDRKFALK